MAAALLKLKQSSNCRRPEVRVRAEAKGSRALHYVTQWTFYERDECEEFRSRKQKLGLAMHCN